MGPAPVAREKDRRTGEEFLAFREETTLPFPEQFISVVDKTPSIFTQVRGQMICFQLHSSGTRTHMVLSVTPPGGKPSETNRGKAAGKGSQRTHPHIHAAPQQSGCSGAFSKQTAERPTHGPSTSACPTSTQGQHVKTWVQPGLTQRGLPHAPFYF